jgi:hypothetical protein
MGICSFNEQLFSSTDTHLKAVTCPGTMTDNVIYNASRYGLFDLSYLFNMGCGVQGISQFEVVHRADYFYFQ